MAFYRQVPNTRKENEMNEPTAREKRKYLKTKTKTKQKFNRTFKSQI